LNPGLTYTHEGFIICVSLAVFSVIFDCYLWLLGTLTSITQQNLSPGLHMGFLSPFLCHLIAVLWMCKFSY